MPPLALASILAFVVSLLTGLLVLRHYVPLYRRDKQAALPLVMVVIGAILTSSQVRSF